MLFILPIGLDFFLQKYKDQQRQKESESAIVQPKQ